MLLTMASSGEKYSASEGNDKNGLIRCEEGQIA